MISLFCSVVVVAVAFIVAAVVVAVVVVVVVVINFFVGDVWFKGASKLTVVFDKVALETDDFLWIK